MAEDGGTGNAHSFERFMEDVRLGFGVQIVRRGRSLWPKPGRSKTMTLYLRAALSIRPLDVKSWIMPELPCNRTNGSPSPRSM